MSRGWAGKKLLRRASWFIDDRLVSEREDLFAHYAEQDEGQRLPVSPQPPRVASHARAAAASAAIASGRGARRRRRASEVPPGDSTLVRCAGQRSPYEHRCQVCPPTCRDGLRKRSQMEASGPRSSPPVDLPCVINAPPRRRCRRAPRAMALASGCLTVSHSLTSVFAACSSVVGSSSVSEFDQKGSRDRSGVSETAPAGGGTSLGRTAPAFSFVQNHPFSCRCRSRTCPISHGGRYDEHRRNWHRDPSL